MSTTAIVNLIIALTTLVTALTAAYKAYQAEQAAKVAGAIGTDNRQALVSNAAVIDANHISTAQKIQEIHAQTNAVLTNLASQTQQNTIDTAVAKQRIDDLPAPVTAPVPTPVIVANPDPVPVTETHTGRVAL